MDPKWSGCSTSLDDWPTSDPTHSIPLLEQEYTFGGEGSEHDRWLQAIRADPITLGHIRRYDQCGTNAWVQENLKTGQCRLIFNTCKLRVCPICSRIAARRVKERLQTALSGTRLKKWRLITLTVRSEPVTLKDSIQSLVAAFKRLRRTDNWRRYITGGYAVLEITFNQQTQLWHPHFHVVAGGLFYPWRELRDDWTACSDGSTVTDIRAIKTTAGAIHYLTSYLGKLAQADTATPIERLTEYYRTIQGMRFLISFGAAPPPKKPPKEPLTDDWRNVCQLWQYVIALRDGEIWALCLGKKLHRSPLNELAFADHHPPPY